MFGYIYILSNPSMPNIVKIGTTERDPKDRASEISGATGVPSPFVMEYSILVPDFEKAERELHSALHGNRISDSREFFTLALEKAVEVVRNKAVDLLASYLLQQYDDKFLERLMDFIYMKNPALRNHFQYR